MLWMASHGAGWHAIIHYAPAGIAADMSVQQRLPSFLIFASSTPQVQRYDGLHVYGQEISGNPRHFPQQNV
jgi:hypothetical protein